MIRRILILFAFIFLIYSCRNNKADADRNFGISIKSEPITGNIFIDSKGQEYDFRILKVRGTNDTTIPINIEMHFPQKCFYFYSILNNPFKVFLLPDTLKGQRQYDFITDLDSCSNKCTLSNFPSIILPKQNFTITFGALSKKTFVGANYSLLSRDKNLQDIILSINGVTILVGQVSYVKH